MNKHGHPAILALWLFLASAGGAAEGAEKTRVQVDFSVQEATYKGRFQEAALKGLQSRVSLHLASILKEKAAFLEFTAEPEPDFKLLCRLNRKDPSSTSSLNEVGFHIELLGTDADGGSAYWWTFRPLQASLSPLGNVEAFEREIQLRLSEGDYLRLTEEVLSRIPIARTGRFLSEPRVGWIIPHRQCDLQMDSDSILRIESVLRSDLGPLVVRFMAQASGTFNPPSTATISADLEQFRGHILCLAVPSQAELSELRAAPDRVSVRAVFVSRYHARPAGCERPISPGEINFNR